jgi:hypothetical protein
MVPSEVHFPAHFMPEFVYLSRDDKSMIAFQNIDLDPA